VIETAGPAEVVVQGAQRLDVGHRGGKLAE
jgi:hypothetical protein